MLCHNNWSTRVNPLNNRTEFLLNNNFFLKKEKILSYSLICTTITATECYCWLQYKNTWIQHNLPRYQSHNAWKAVHREVKFHSKNILHMYVVFLNNTLILILWKTTSQIYVDEIWNGIRNLNLWYGFI